MKKKLRALGHSKNKQGKEQLYEEHIDGVCTRIDGYYHEMKPYCRYGSYLHYTAAIAGDVHDLGKLHEKNKEVLQGLKKALALPFHHSDAGASTLIKKGFKNAALLVASHHKGLCNFLLKDCKLRNIRDKTDYGNTTVEKVSDRYALTWYKEHRGLVKSSPKKLMKDKKSLPSLFYRMALSMLVDADHSDTGDHYENIVAEEQNFKLRPLERLKVLDRYVKGKWSACNKKLALNKLRNDLYKYCRHHIPFPKNKGVCGAGTGLGKTTSIPAHLLLVAAKRKSRKMFYVGPFTNLLNQTVEVFKKALVLPGENPDDIIGVHHHRVEYNLTKYEGIYNMAATKLWRHPITVTTAVQFFETLASCRTSRLRKLHELPGSVIFIDESHTMLPDHLLALGYELLLELVRDWGCYVIFGSGTQTDFWRMKRFSPDCKDIPDLFTREFAKKYSKIEDTRIKYSAIKKKLDRRALEKAVLTVPGPRLVVLNTVNNAACIASYMRGRGHTVEHLSTSMRYDDIEKTLKRIFNRLKKKQKNWTLVATAIIEAGMDFSFMNGFREINSINSIGQTGGRVNRECNPKNTKSRLYIFETDQNDGFNENYNFRLRVQIAKDEFKKFRGLFNIRPEHFVRAFKKSVLEAIAFNKDEYIKKEKATQFRDVGNEFNVIDNEGALTAIQDVKLIRSVRKAMAEGERIPWREVHKQCFRITGSKKTEQYREGVTGNLDPNQESEQLYLWKGAYDDFLGYYAQFYGHYYK